MRTKLKDGEILRKRRGETNLAAGGFFGKLLYRLVVVVFVLGCIIYSIITMSTVSEKRDELAQIQAKTEALEAENVELSRILESEDMNAYMEKIAIESMNYAYPNERRFYDISRN